MKDNQRIYERMRDELIISQRSNSENFDKAILSLSSAGLGITLSFISNLIDLSKAYCIVILYFTWILFVLAIISTLISFLVSQKGISEQLKMAEKIYLENETVDNKNIMKISNWVNRLNTFSAITFILAILFLVIFSITNISKGAIKMSGNNKARTTVLNEPKPSNNFQKTVNANVTRGLPINNLQPVVKPTTTSYGKPNNKTTNSGTKK